MLGELGLAQDPFAPHCDGSLYWESSTRRQVREQVVEHLSAGRSVWLQGPAGAGRQSLLLRAAEDLAGQGVQVALLGSSAPASAAALLQPLAQVIGADAPAAPELLDLAAGVYRRLVEVFCARGACAVVLPWAAPDAAHEEIALLAALQLLGRSLVAVGTCGGDAPPGEPFQAVTLSAPTPEELRHCVQQRCAAGGRADVLPADALERVAAHAGGFAHAMCLARAELAREAFHRCGGLAPADAPDAAAGVLDPLALQEVDHLLAALRPESPAT